ncbi:MAG: TolC family protein [Terriglobia bacterium]|jgi:cobalt-zinc-cadmium efflux system outer membrane protein|nr:TolC family protein [Terriglobia bacterium]
MTIKQAIAFSFALLLSMGATAQEHQSSMPGMHMPPQQKQQPAQQQATQPGPLGAPGMQTPQGALPTIEQQQQAMPQHEMKMENMEMHSPETTPSQIIGLQEQENPNMKTGDELPVPDLLAGARKAEVKKLDDFEQLALKNNPTMKQAQAIAGESSALARQAGLWPNPSIGYQGEQIRGGSYRGGEQGGFVQQNIVLGGKLRRRKEVFEQQRRADNLGIEEQRLNVLGGVRVRFYQALAAQRTVEVRQRLLQIALDAAATAHQLANVGQADAPDILQTEVEAEQAKLDFVRAQREYIQAFNTLAVISGQPGLPLTFLDGDLEHPPEIDIEHWGDTAVQRSPAIKRAEQEAKRAEAVLSRDKREAIPDLTLRAGIQQNRELDPESMRPVGAQGFATASIQIPLFNRNQGNVEASRLELERARQEIDRTKFSLAQQAQPFLQRYATEKLEVERYRMQMIPRAQRAYELYLQKYRNMAAAYPEVIISQRTYFQLQENYARALGELWSSAVQLQNYLYADGLSAPRSSGSTATQVNLPSGGTGGSE